MPPGGADMAQYAMSTIPSAREAVSQGERTHLRERDVRATRGVLKSA